MSGSTALSTARRYEEHIANKVQLLLDATLGLINVELNNIIKVLTIVWGRHLADGASIHKSP